MNDSSRLYENRNTKYARTVHAEVNAILSAHERVDGCTAYVTAPPCTACALVLIQSGIKKVVCLKPTADLVSRWGEQFKEVQDFFKEANIEYEEIDIGNDTGDSAGGRQGHNAGAGYDVGNHGSDAVRSAAVYDGLKQAFGVRSERQVGA